MGNDDAQVRTLLGAYLRAFMLERHDESAALREEFDAHDGDDDEFAGMIDAVFTVVVHRVFRPPVDPYGIKGLADLCRARFGEAVLTHEMQMLIRYRLGPSDASAPVVAWEDRMLMQLLATNQLVGEAGLDDELDALIAEAEDLAEYRGLHPIPLAGR
ncbi:hypothetical protein ABT297_10635 [Dactylosporangium sp. NPDC000555]|uniref:hypothetical protein n=1 Tax=Dactylosporangium sp. NPDC000555 TaxID=3154260 RepID=UPI0033291054